MRPRHVVLNALFLEPDRSAGSETYLRGLVPELAQVAPHLELTLMTTRKGFRRLADDGWESIVTLVALRTDEGERLHRLWNELVVLPLQAQRRAADLLHSLSSTAPVYSRVPQVISLHDVTFFHTRTFGWSTTLALRAITRLAVRNATWLTTVSEVSRQEIVGTLGVDPSRITVAPNGAGRPPDVAPAPAAEVRAALRLPPDARIVLNVAALRPHKNQELLLHALTELPDDVVLICVGHREPYADRLEAIASDLGVAGRVRIAGYVPDDHLERLWLEAGAAAFPTRAEGFGLPVLEALARGVPVACADIAVLHEVGGDVPHYFPLGSPAAAAAAIRAAMDDDVRDRGPSQAARFTWRRTAEKTVDAYERALACTSG